MKKVAIIMGSDSDLPVVAPAIKQLKELGIETEVRVMSAHRTPKAAQEFSENAIENGFGVIIAAAGMAAHLGGVLAASTTLPVIGIPCSAKVLDGMDAMLATVMMPPGIPVATVGVNAAKNAALLAAEIIAVGNDDLCKSLSQCVKIWQTPLSKRTRHFRKKLKNYNINPHKQTRRKIWKTVTAKVMRQQALMLQQVTNLSSLLNRMSKEQPFRA